MCHEKAKKLQEEEQEEADGVREDKRGGGVRRARLRGRHEDGEERQPSPPRRPRHFLGLGLGLGLGLYDALGLRTLRGWRFGNPGDASV